ncbi:MAG: acyl-CoA dehydrogenase family protein [Acidobacteria bacterium]|nr:acyl-CoA dehydrogenase family protein [Acidobacteriota bacterium]
MTVDLGLSTDQEAIADLFGGFFAKESPTTVARAAEPFGFDAGLWAKLVELGAPGMGSPVGIGGGGASLSDLVVVAEALGRAIAPVPLIEHLAAALLLTDADVVAGEAIATVAVRPTDADGLWRLVPAGAVADVVVGVDGDELVAVRSEPPMVAPRNHAAAPLADRSARTGQRTVLGPAVEFVPVLDRWKVLTSAALVGIADAAMALGVQYVMDRQQFGVPIGSFQAVQHGLADLPVMIDGGRLLTHKAAWAIDSGEVGINDWALNDITDGSTLASMAYVFTTDGAALATDRSLHYHGGYGFSEEYDIQLYYRRARGWSLVLDDPSVECLALADRLFGAREA